MPWASKMLELLVQTISRNSRFFQETCEMPAQKKRDWGTTCDLLQSNNLSKSRELHNFMYKEYTLTCCRHSVTAQCRRVSSCGIKSCRHQHDVWLKFFSYWNHYWTECCKVLWVSIYRILEEKKMSKSLLELLMRETSNLATMNMCTVCVVVQCNPWFKLYFPFWGGMEMYDNKIKQRKLKPWPKVKLDHHIVHIGCISVGTTQTVIFCVNA